MQENIEFTKKYYSERGAGETLAERSQEWSPEMQAEATRQWDELFRDVEASLDEDPKSEKAQALAARWRKLVEAFTGGDPEVSKGAGEGLGRPGELAGKDDEEQTAGFADPKVWEFIQKVMK